MFQLQSVSIHYDDLSVLTDISFEIRPGEKVALVGESGCGKSSLLNYLRQQLAAEQLAWCPQHHGLVPPLSAFHNIFMGRLEQYSLFQAVRNLIVPLASEKQIIEQLLVELGLSEKLMISIDRLSGGQQQRVALARALFRQAAVFLGDEPVSALDPVQGKKMLQLINQRHQTSVVALHDRDLALACFDRVIALGQQQIVLDAPASQLTRADLDAVYARR
ncbi:ATP-binding cassette domain-containing protein [Pelagibaculum spongiae]|uniref:Phosphonate ABC transporter ATP-binding protein n=1 Tax=Pelagibaculum spongiae TaxID=2080658 RepID=A0A2V1H0U8_9GAMM|nr:ATP-binding cassette domain-containing protein [Pelagibaculum spongiae]PVZ69703.1 phosphonate ABC transporter ATP-binding protein [Pelagibaculum spongiae]